jgi:hypothetical protein
LKFRENSTEEYTRGRSTGRAHSGSEDEAIMNGGHVGAERASITSRARRSDSPYVESIMHGRTLSDDSPTRPAECHWHMVFVERDGEALVVFVGSWTTVGVAHYAEGAEIPPARRQICRHGDGPTRCFESILLAKGVRVGISRSRERGDVRRQARAQRRACSRPARGHRVARPTAGVVTPDGAVPLLSGPPGCPKAASARSSAPNRQRSSCDKASRSPTPFTRSAISINRI